MTTLVVVYKAGRDEPATVKGEWFDELNGKPEGKKSRPGQTGFGCLLLAREPARKGHRAKKEELAILSKTSNKKSRPDRGSQAAVSNGQITEGGERPRMDSGVAMEGYVIGQRSPIGRC